MEEQVLSAQEQQGKEAKKIEQRFQNSIGNLTALLKGNKTVFKKPKVGNTDLDGLLEEMLKERKEEALKKFKVDALAFFDKKVAFDKLIVEKQKAFDAEVLKAKKEFADEADKLFGQVEDVNTMVKQYKDSLGGGVVSETITPLNP